MQISVHNCSGQSLVHCCHLQGNLHNIEPSHQLIKSLVIYNSRLRFSLNLKPYLANQQSSEERILDPHQTDQNGIVPGVGYSEKGKNEGPLCRNFCQFQASWLIRHYGSQDSHNCSLSAVQVVIPVSRSTEKNHRNFQENQVMFIII